MMSNQGKWFQSLLKIKSLPRHPTPTPKQKPGQAINHVPGKSYYKDDDVFQLTSNISSRFNHSDVKG